MQKPIDIKKDGEDVFVKIPNDYLKFFKNNLDNSFYYDIVDVLNDNDDEYKGMIFWAESKRKGANV